MAVVDAWGRRVCQARGCDEPAEAWGTIVEWAESDLELEVFVCRRHLRGLVGIEVQVEEIEP